MLLTVPQLLEQARAGVTTVTAAVAVEENAGKSGLFVDVREPGEVAQKPVAGSVNMPRGVLEMQMLAQFQQADLPIYIHCASGARAVLAAEQLQRVGYTQVKAISCGIDLVCQVLS